jgi:pimeloyl-ACP methyl ester carboxylesterase
MFRAFPKGLTGVVAISLVGIPAAVMAGLPVEGPAEETGVLDGARFYIVIPEDWNGGLVMYMHGYLPPEIEHPPFPGEEGAGGGGIRGIQLPEVAVELGYAVARSAYSRQGFAMEEGVTETDALREYFQEKYGATYPTIIAGGHNGGLMTYDAIERFADHYDGALAIGGIGAPKLEWLKERAFDMRVLFDHLYPKTPGSVVEFPEGQTWSSFRPQLMEIIAEDPERAAPLLRLYDLESNADLARCVNLYTSILGDLYTNRAGGNAFDNTNTVYTGFPDDAEVNRGVERYTSDPEAVAYVREWNTPRCRITKPVIGVNGLDDPVVPVSSQRRYAEMCEREGTSGLFVQLWMDQASPSPSNEGMAFLLTALADWIQGGKRPERGELARVMAASSSGGVSDGSR